MSKTRKLKVYLLCMMAVMLMGCAKDSESEEMGLVDVSGNMAETEGDTDVQSDTSLQGEYVNLNFSNAVYDIPEMENFVNLTYYLPYSGEEYGAEEEKILANMERMAGSSDATYLKWWKLYGEEYEQPEDGSYIAPRAVPAADMESHAI